jgi:hypothetical protein
MAATILKDMTEMRNVLECPICMTLAILGPIKQCKNGHHLCDNCASRIQKCPSCEEKIDIRARQLEKLRDVTPIPCQHVENGCKVELKLKDLQIHQNQCNHGLLHCPIPSCPEKIPFQDLILHLDVKHDNFEKFLTSGSTILTFGVNSDTFLNRLSNSLHYYRALSFR